MRMPEFFQPVTLAGYSGYLLEIWNVPDFRVQLQAFLASDRDVHAPLTKYSDRAVYCLKLNSGEVYIKRYLINNLKPTIQALFQAHKAQKSWRIARILLRKGILTPQPVAFLHCRTSWRSGEYLLITQGVAGGLSLREYWQFAPEKKYLSSYFQEGDNPIALKRALIRSVAEFLGKLHLAGAYHGDLTANNILLARCGEQWRVYLIDLDAVRSTRWISERRRIKNLDELGRNFLDLRLLTTPDRLRFLKYYLNTYTKETRTLRELFYAVLQRTQFRLQKHQQQFIRSAPPSTFMYHSDFVKEPPVIISEFQDKPKQQPVVNMPFFDREPGWRLHIFPAWQDTFQTLADVAGFLARPKIVLQSHNRGEVFLIRHSGQQFIVKRSLTQEKRWWAQFTSWYRAGEGERTLRNMERLHTSGLPVPQPVFILEKKRFGFVMASWSVYQYLEGQPCTCAEVERIAAMLRTLHQQGWVHRDPHVKNFLLHDDQIRMIDCTRARPWRSRYARMYDVVLLNKCCPGSMKYYGVPDADWVYQLAQWQCSLLVSWRRLKRRLRFWKK
ncbi:lipopolysaccharide core biosynthesis protein rfaY [Candidatus Vecturithrix granuli]|uniref:Lipopolysaccharide core biosynthesis protein rfaY n=1 Tax=Vecturithrix granuli TaxID=1499967 RepID=A0A0S6W9H5_VECG1|nr:lipopolysaccharide core biosynthesis protein rfaY [Candidatus Vecturithrix granuli]